MSQKETVVSGIRSTGYLHLGNYFGAIHNYVKMQEDYNCYFFVADYHSLTTHPDPKDLKANVFRVAAENIASGLDPEISPENARLQVQRIARARGVDPTRVMAVIDDRVEGRDVGVLGEPRVNVLTTNPALDRKFGRLARATVSR